MMESTNAAIERIDGREAGPGKQPVLLTVNDVAKMLNCSVRTIYRLTDSGRMPRPIKLNALVRWRRETIDIWISRGCPDVRREVRS